MLKQEIKEQITKIRSKWLLKLPTLKSGFAPWKINTLAHKTATTQHILRITWHFAYILEVSE